MFEQIEPPESEEKCYRVTCDFSCKMIMNIWAKNKEEAEELASNYKKYDFIDAEMIEENIEYILNVNEKKE